VPDIGPGTNFSFVRDLSFDFLPGITGPVNASSIEQNALLISPNGGQVLLSTFMPTQCKGMTDGILWSIFVIGLALVFVAYNWKPRESFINMGGLASLTTQALDAAPTTSELKNHYKNLLIFADDDIRKQGVAGLRILADFRTRLFGQRDFRDNLVIDDFKGNWPAWLPPLDTTIKEPVPDSATAATAESQMLAYLQKNFPQEDMVDDQTRSTIRNLVEDFGYRFVFKKGEEVVQLKPDFMAQPLVKGWTNPAARA
jgi:hypothetical protein